MKLNSSLLAVIFSLLTICLVAQNNNLDLFFFTSQSVQSYENNLYYQLTPSPSWLMFINALDIQEDRMNFSQHNRHSLLNLNLSSSEKLLRHSFHSGYEYFYDSSELDDKLQPYNSQTGILGYSLELVPDDSLLVSVGAEGCLRSEKDRYILGNKLNSDGYLIFGKANGGLEFWNLNAGFAANLEQKKLDWEFYQTGTISAYLNHLSDQFSFNNNLFFNQRSDNLYVLLPEEEIEGRGYYGLYDRQKKQSFQYAGYLEYVPSDEAKLTIQDVFTKRNTNLDFNTVKNNKETGNQVSLALNLMPWTQVGWTTIFNHSYLIKDYNLSQNSRQTENRFLSTVASWEYIKGDTLSAGFSVDLQRASFPEYQHRWDNDLRNIHCSLINVHYWKERLKLSNRFYWNLTDDVYVNSILSGNNKQITSYIYNPECAILIGDCLLFDQNYVIRADYTDYEFTPSEKALYRQLKGDYKLVFDSYPFIARSNDQCWLLIPYRPHRQNAFLTSLNFGFEQNEYADYERSVYIINFRNIRYTLGLTIKQDIYNFYYYIQPQYSWGTWKEYNFQAGLAWKLADSSLLEFTVNPVGKDLKNLDWRTSISINAAF